MNKKIVLTGVTSIMLFGINVAQAEVAQIVAINGTAVIERANHKYQAQYGMVLEEGDIVRSIQGKVRLQYANCVSMVNAAYEVRVSTASPCATAKKAKASDLIVPAAKKYKIQRIDNNLAEAECSACKVNLAKRGAGFSSPGAVRAIGGGALLALLAKNSSGSNKTNSPVDTGGNQGGGDTGGNQGSGDTGGNQGSGDTGGNQGSGDTGGNQGSGDTGGNQGGGDTGGNQGSNDTGGNLGGNDSGGDFGGNSDIPVSPL